MKVYIVTPESFPYGMAAVQRIRCYAKAILLGGIDCEIVCYRRFPKEFAKGDACVSANGESEGIHYSYMGNTPIRHNNPFVRKALDYWDKFSALKYLNKSIKKGDIIFWYCGSDVSFTLRLFSMVKAKGAYVVRDLCELPYGTKEETPQAIKNRKIVLSKQFPLLDGVVVISDTLGELAKSYCNPQCEIVKVPIMVDFNKYELDDKSSEETIPYIFHSGTLKEQKDGILGVFEAFGKACQKLEQPIKFISTGKIEKSPHKREILGLIEKYNLQDKLIFTGYLTDEELRDKLSHASLVIINKYRTQQNKYCFSTKLGEYMAASKPVIITNVGEAMNYLKADDNAYIVESENNDALALAIVNVFNHLGEARMVGVNGKKTCRENFDYRSQSKVLCDFLKSISSKSDDKN